MVTDISVVLLSLSALLLAAALVQPLAQALRLPPSVLLAAVGSGLGSLAWFGLHGGLAPAAELTEAMNSLSLRSATFLIGFLPPLLFQAALTIDVRRMLDDAAPILLLAVVAVLVAATVVGVSLSWLSGMPLVACLLLGSIIATTDPAAVIAIFRDIGAPARLTRLVEGECLLNDAAAIALFTVLLAMLTGQGPVEAGEGVVHFFVTFLGGMAFGALLGRLLMLLVPLLRGIAAAEFTLTLSAPWLAFIIGEHNLHVSGVVAVVACGLTFAAMGPGRFSPGNWHQLKEIWEQVAAIAGSLVFILAALLVPPLVADLTWSEAGLVLAVVAAALIARALVLFGMFPLLTAVRLAERVSRSHRMVILWGGLRGAVTLALALSVTENRLMDPELKRFVAVMATGFVLFTLFVNGITLRPVMRLLRLDRLSPVNQALRDQVLALALAEVRDGVTGTGRAYGIGPGVVTAVAGEYDQRAQPAAGTLSDKDSLNLALMALAHRERELILHHHGQRTVPIPVVERMLRDAGRLFDGARTEGRHGYARAARRALRFSRTFRLAHWLHRRAGLDRPLAARLETRSATLLVHRLVLAELRDFASRRLQPLLGARVAEVATEVLETRQSAVQSGLDALRLQYPDYAEALERRFLQQHALDQERRQYDALRDEGVIGDDLHEHLRRSVKARSRADDLPRLDLGLDTRSLMRTVPLFAELDDARLDRVATLLRPRFAVPDERIVRKGDRGDGMYFLSSGAAEVQLAQQTVYLGRGDFFGEMALLTRQPRSADVKALTYCQLLFLPEDEFRNFLAADPDLRDHMDRIAFTRRQENREPAA